RPRGLHLGPREHEPGLEPLEELVVEPSTAILGDQLGSGRRRHVGKCRAARSSSYAGFLRWRFYAGLLRWASTLGFYAGLSTSLSLRASSRSILSASDGSLSRRARASSRAMLRHFAWVAATGERSDLPLTAGFRLRRAWGAIDTLS